MVVEKVFDLWQARIRIEHDSSVIGRFTPKVTSQQKRGTYQTMTEARKAKTRLIEEFVANGWVVNKDSSVGNILVLCIGAINEVHFWIEERIKSEKPCWRKTIRRG